MEDLTLRSYNYLMNDCYERIKSKKPYDVNFKPYTEEFIKKVMVYFEEREEYEKCKTLSEFINIKFNHDSEYISK